MNDKDKEAFDRWNNDSGILPSEQLRIFFGMSEQERIKFALEQAWQAACEYKQQGIDELKNVAYWAYEKDGIVTRHISIADVQKLQAEVLEYKEAARSEAALVNELQSENVKLREALVYIAKVYDRPTDMKVKARHTLAELDKDNNDK